VVPPCSPPRQRSPRRGQTQARSRPSPRCRADELSVISKARGAVRRARPRRRGPTPHSQHVYPLSARPRTGSAGGGGKENKNRWKGITRCCYYYYYCYYYYCTIAVPQRRRPSGQTGAARPVPVRGPLGSAAPLPPEELLPLARGRLGGVGVGIPPCWVQLRAVRCSLPAPLRSLCAGAAGPQDAGSAKGPGERGEKGGEGGGEGAGTAPSGCGAESSSPGSQQTVCGDVTPEFQTMINMIICIKFEWVLVFRENASDDECS